MYIPGGACQGPGDRHNAASKAYPVSCETTPAGGGTTTNPRLQPCQRNPEDRLPDCTILRPRFTPMVTDPVNPAYDEVPGVQCYPTLADLPEVPDVVDISRRPEAIPGVVDEAIAVGAQVMWFRLGLCHDEAARRALDAGLRLVQNRCLKIEHARWHGGLHLGGFDTGVISSTRHRRLGSRSAGSCRMWRVQSSS